MDTIPSISNIPRVQTRRNAPRRLESIPRIDTANLDTSLPLPPTSSVSLNNTQINILIYHKV